MSDLVFNPIQFYSLQYRSGWAFNPWSYTRTPARPGPAKTRFLPSPNDGRNFLPGTNGARIYPSIQPLLPRPAGDDSIPSSSSSLSPATPVSSAAAAAAKRSIRPRAPDPPNPTTNRRRARKIQIWPLAGKGESEDGCVDVACVVPHVPGAGVQARRCGARQRGEDHHALQAPPRRGRHRRAHHRQQRRGGRLQEPALRGLGSRRARKPAHFVGDVLPGNARRDRCDRQHGPRPDQHHQGRAVPAAAARGPGGRGGPGVREQAGPQGRHGPRGDHRRAVPPQHKGPRLAHPGLVRHHRRGPLRRPGLDRAEGRRQGDRELTLRGALLVVVREWIW